MAILFHPVPIQTLTLGTSLYSIEIPHTYNPSFSLVTNIRLDKTTDWATKKEQKYRSIAPDTLLKNELNNR